MIIGQAFGWVFDPANYGGYNGIPTRVWEHVWITLLAVLIAALLGGGMYLAWQAGLFEGTDPAPVTSEQPTTQEIITEWVTPTPEAEPTTEQPPETVTEWITPTPEPEPEPEPEPTPETTPDPVQPEQPAPPDNGGGTPGELDQLLEDLGNLTNGGN